METRLVASGGAPDIMAAIVWREEKTVRDFGGTKIVPTKILGQKQHMFFFLSVLGAVSIQWQHNFYCSVLFEFWDSE